MIAEAGTGAPPAGAVRLDVVAAELVVAAPVVEGRATAAAAAGVVDGEAVVGAVIEGAAVEGRVAVGATPEVHPLGTVGREGTGVAIAGAVFGRGGVGATGPEPTPWEGAAREGLV